MNSFRTTLTLTAVAALAVSAGGCTNVDRAGGKSADAVTTLTFAQQGDGQPPPQLQAWADQVERASNGSLTIDFKNGWRSGEVGGESATVADVKDGKVDLAWVGARVFDRVGVTDFQALLAPMLVDSHDLQAAIFEEGIPEEMLAGVADAGVQGLAVLPGPMRKLLGVEKAFVAPADFRGKVVGMQDSALTQRAMETLGAETLALPGGAKLEGVDAYEQQLASIFGNGYVTRADYVTGNLDLWPRPSVLIANPEAFEALSDHQRAVLLQAGIDSVPSALDLSRVEDEEAVDNLCRQGMVLTAASDAQLADLEQAWQPLYDELAADSDTAGWLERIRALKESLGAGPDTSVCSADEPSVDGGDDADKPTESEELTGVWTTELTAADWSDAGFDGPAGTWTLEFADGWVTGTQPDGEIGYQARYSAFRGRLVTSQSIDVLHASYRIAGDRLYLSDVTVPGASDGGPYAVVWASHPYTRQSS